MGDRCNKCRSSRRAEGNTWCLGCLSWESLERELVGSWQGPAGLRVIADNLVLGAAREVRALRALGAGLGLASTAGAGASSAATQAPVVKQELVGATAKKKPPEEESGDYASEESEEEEPAEEDGLARPVSPPKIDKRPELPRRSSRAPQNREKRDQGKRSKRQKSLKKPEGADQGGDEKTQRTKEDRRISTEKETDVKEEKGCLIRQLAVQEEAQEGKRKEEEGSIRDLTDWKLIPIVLSTGLLTKECWTDVRGWRELPCLKRRFNGRRRWR